MTTPDQTQRPAPPAFRCNACGSEACTVMGRRSDGIDVLRCDACSLGVVAVMPADLEAYYDDAYYGAAKTDTAVGYGDYKFAAEHGISWAVTLVRMLKSGGRILDIGCADGSLLARLPASFDRYGIEVNHHMAEQAAARGAWILGHDLMDPAILREHRGRFDVVTSIAVFEHLADLRGGMRASLELLKLDGVLLFEVPYISTERENRMWFESSLEHVFYPAGDTLRRLVEDLGAHLVGGEVYVQDFASTYVGIAFHDRAMANDIQRLFNTLTSVTGPAGSSADQLARQRVMLIHAAQSTPDLVRGLSAIPLEELNRPLMQRLEQIWTGDLLRLADARQKTQRIQENAWREQQRISARHAAALSEAEGRLVNQLRRSEAERRRIIATAYAERDAARAELAGLRNSTSWKLTAPLRHMVAAYVRPQARRRLRQLMKLVWWTIRLELPSRLMAARRIRISTRPVNQPSAVAAPSLAFQTWPDTMHFVTEDDDMTPWPSDRPLVSVIVPCFNYGQYVAEAVDSVLAQTFTDLEVIVVEGGSTDPDSRRQTMALERPRTRILSRNEPHPVGNNRNFGIANARGKYICCLDADDKLAPTYIEKALYLLEAYDYDVVSCAIQMFGDSEERVGVPPAPSLGDFLVSNPVLTCAVFRRKLWRQAGGYHDADPNVTGIIYEDWLFWAHLSALGARMRNLAGDYLFLYRRHGPSLSGRATMHPEEVHRQLIHRALGNALGPEAVLRSRIAAEQKREAKFVLADLERVAARDDRRPVLLLALPFTIVGGAERLLSRITAHLAARGWRVIITTSIDPGTQGGDTTPWFEPATREIFHLPRFLDAELWPGFVRYLVASRAVDIVWVVGSAFMYDMLAPLREEFPDLAVADLLFNPIGHTTNNRKHARLIDVTFVENNEVREFLRRAGETVGRIVLAPSGVDLDAYQPSPRDPVVALTTGAGAQELIVGFSGRWAEEKDPLGFIDIATRSSQLPARFVMTGAGVMRAEIEAKLRDANLPEGRFHLAGEVGDVVPWLRSYDVLLLPSRLDGRPVVVLEALALGVPVIASRVGALPELIEHGKNGFLCAPGDVEDFARHLALLANDLALLARMKEAARAFAEQHLDARRMLDLYEAKLRSLVPGIAKARNMA